MSDKIEILCPGADNIVVEKNEDDYNEYLNITNECGEITCLSRSDTASILRFVLQDKKMLLELFGIEDLAIAEACTLIPKLLENQNKFTYRYEDFIRFDRSGICVWSTVDNDGEMGAYSLEEGSEIDGDIKPEFVGYICRDEAIGIIAHLANQYKIMPSEIYSNKNAKNNEIEEKVNQQAGQVIFDVERSGE